MNPQIDQYLLNGCMRCKYGGTPSCKVHNWTAELELLRKIVLDCGLTEELKWGVPCYTHKGKNVVILSAFKEFCSVNFFKGALLKDPQKLLVKPGENSQASRLLKFTDVEQVEALRADIRSYILEAVEVEKAGLKVNFRKKTEPVPEELENMFAEKPDFKKAFAALTPGRQRGYLLHFSQPKQAKTRISRIEKCVPKIMKGEGLHDTFRKRK